MDSSLWFRNCHHAIMLLQTALSETDQVRRDGFAGVVRGERDRTQRYQGAEPGDTVEVIIRPIDLWLPIAAMSFRANRGALPEDFPYSRDRVFFIDPAKKVIEFAPGIAVPAKPFWGIISASHLRALWDGCRADRPTCSAAIWTTTICSPEQACSCPFTRAAP